LFVVRPCASPFFFFFFFFLASTLRCSPGLHARLDPVGETPEHHAHYRQAEVGIDDLSLASGFCNKARKQGGGATMLATRV